VIAFLTHLAVDLELAAATRSQAFVAMLLYGSGLRLMECVTLRVKDLDLDRREIRVRRGKEAKTALPCCRSRLFNP
jgi:site-specific recombinase XerC